MPPIERVEFWISFTAKIAGAITIIVPLCGFRRFSSGSRGQVSGGGDLIRFPIIGLIAILYVSLGILLWRPIPLNLSAVFRLISQLVGSILYFPAIALYLWGYRTLGRMYAPSSAFGASLYKDHRLVTEGPYRIIRHPMYIAVIIAAAGALLIFKTWAMILFTFSSLVVVERARREDRLLSSELGEEWESYRSRIPGWIPRLIDM